jgi:hypothetical protein
MVYGQGPQGGRRWALGNGEQGGVDVHLVYQCHAIKVMLRAIDVIEDFVEIFILDLGFLLDNDQASKSVGVNGVNDPKHFPTLDMQKCR